LNIYDFGWNDQITSEPFETENIARITTVHRGYSRAITESGEVNVYLSGQFHLERDFTLAVGDFVRIGPRFIDEQDLTAAILMELYPRRSKFSRIAAGSDSKEQVLASHLDLLFIVTSANEDMSLNRLQRFILLAKNGGIEPVVVLSKTDLNPKSNELLIDIEARTPGVKVIGCSAIQKTGLECIEVFISKGKTAAFVGSSGVGKSSLVNCLLEEERQKTLEIREEDGKGRHTTTSRELFFLKNGGMVIDTAGLREVQIFSEESSLSDTFQEITRRAQACKFSDCSHESETGCAIQSGLLNGEIREDEYQNYLKLLKEVQYTKRKMNRVTSSNDKKRWKSIHKNMRARRKFEGKD